MEIVATKNAPDAVGPYSQGMINDGILYSAGQIALVPETGVIEADTIEGQAEQVCRNLGAVLEAAGSSFSQVIKTTCYLADMNDFAAFNDVYARFFTGEPARSCVAVQALPKNALCEIEVIAAVDEPAAD